MRWPFRRSPSGKHALGAAVTAIPDGPVAPVRRLPVELPTVPVQAVTPDRQPLPVVPARDVVAAPPSVVPQQSVVSEHLVAAPVERFVEPPALLVPEQPVLSAPPVEADAPVRSVLVDLPTVPVLPTARAQVPPEPSPPAAPAQAPSPPPVPAVPGRVPVQPLPPEPPSSGLDALLAAASAVESWPAVAPPVAPPTPSALRQGTRVELGFADGTIRMLDPESEAARALSQLVGELTSPAPSRGESSPAEGSAAR